MMGIRQIILNLKENQNQNINNMKKVIKVRGMAKGMGARVELKRGGGAGLYANIHAKKARIAAGSGEKMRKPGTKGAPTAASFKRAAKTAKKA